ncbi:TPA: hypothetical protein ACV5ZF_004644 [Salmonella enterica]|uniref:hypothetical protein n=1 Tax=Salmonella enterica TaxID=28901 RepID=UPI0013E0D4A3|nr:hypothetical protein [Salmonella enterica]HCB5747115.1 hypothetical protein [Salmonella enterica subsp. salamae]HCM1852972.1 hypothetical protein [Salmonella enterica subsp. salamae serovar 42:z29:-]EEP0942729.1 hypothetical protein [Salmonella enterica]EEP0947286.1 hypothetical protein [Salmonella enterica]EEP0951989.1 hypothetical protein [Salmonella enterica]
MSVKIRLKHFTQTIIRHHHYAIFFPGGQKYPVKRILTFPVRLTRTVGLGDIATHNADEFLPSTYTPPAAPVTSVNGKTGDVQLSAADVHALPDTYVPPAPDLSGYETIADANARFVQGIQLGAAATMGYDTSEVWPVPAGCVMTGLLDGGGDGRGTLQYKPIQRNINGTWTTISG